MPHSNILLAMGPATLFGNCSRIFGSFFNNPKTGLYGTDYLQRAMITAIGLLHYAFRGLLSVHSRYGLHTRQVAFATLCTRGFSSLVASTAALIATGWSEPVPGRVYSRCGPSPFHGAPGNRGGFNGSTQHSARTHLGLKTKAKIARQLRSAGTLPWLGFDRVQPNRSVLQRKQRRIN
jgi:hypothetical protein